MNIDGIEPLGDDFPFCKEIPAKDLLEFLKHPPNWVLNNVTDGLLLNPFVIQIVRDDNLPGVGKVVIQGDRGTNLIFLFVRSDSFATLLEYMIQLSELDRKAQKSLGFAGPHEIHAIMERFTGVTAAGTEALLASTHIDISHYMAPNPVNSRAKVHFSIGGPFSSEAGRLLYLANFIVEMGRNPSSTYDLITQSIKDDNFVIKNFKVDGTLGSTGPLHTLTVTPFTTPGTVPLLYSGDVTSKQEACEMLMALYNNGVITAQQAFIKAYV